MDAIQNVFKNRWFLPALTFVAGLLIGWMLLGWVIWPVEWKDAAPEVLNRDYQREYLEMAIQTYALDGNAQKAAQRFKDLGPAGKSLLDELQAQPGALNPQAVANFAVAVNALPAEAAAPQATQPAGEVGVQPTPAPAAAPKKSNPLTILLPLLCVLFLALAAIVVFFLLRRRSAEAAPAPERPSPAVWTDYSAEENPPITQYVTSYSLGDNLFDESFSIDTPTGEFLGECGVGISETIGVGEPKKVTAFEVWLFDKNDIQTVTKVLMSAHAIEDPTIRQRLESKGDLELVEPGKVVELETRSLLLRARVKDMSYGQGAMPPESYFENFVLEVAVWQK